MLITKPGLSQGRREKIAVGERSSLGFSGIEQPVVVSLVKALGKAKAFTSIDHQVLTQSRGFFKGPIQVRNTFLSQVLIQRCPIMAGGFTAQIAIDLLVVPFLGV